jgi:hypothetical protein
MPQNVHPFDYLLVAALLDKVLLEKVQRMCLWLSAASVSCPPRPLTSIQLGTDFYSP